MKKTALSFFITITLFSCKRESAKGLQFFSEFDISLACPCTLERDTAKELDIKEKVGTKTNAFTCLDKQTGDIYHLDICKYENGPYSNDQILGAIDSSLSSRGIEHRRFIFQENLAIEIDYIQAKQLEVLTNEFSYYFIIKANDSIDSKFDNWINSVKID